jgi:hypothetical protein
MLNRPIRRLRMIATIGGTVVQGATIGTTLVLTTSNISKKQRDGKSKGGTWRFPLLLICRVVSEARK